ncbi:MAG: gliding motility protein GldC [Acidobacteria bacterium]|nr:gliding motility protein GldC [Acidobacteriota bacterium]
MSEKREILFTVELDDQRVPEAIHWQAADAPVEGPQPCDAFLISLWDSGQKSTLRIDLWTKEMQVDHMNAFFFQTLMTMAETFQNATGNREVADDIRAFGREFARKVEMPPEE